MAIFVSNVNYETFWSLISSLIEKRLPSLFTKYIHEESNQHKHKAPLVTKAAVLIVLKKKVNSK